MPSWLKKIAYRRYWRGRFRHSRTSIRATPVDKSTLIRILKSLRRNFFMQTLPVSKEKKWSLIRDTIRKRDKLEKDMKWRINFSHIPFRMFNRFFERNYESLLARVKLFQLFKYLCVGVTKLNWFLICRLFEWVQWWYVAALLRQRDEYSCIPDWNFSGKKALNKSKHSCWVYLILVRSLFGNNMVQGFWQYNFWGMVS